mmetsp:Transcript_33235/g.53526  ORF Transcript_33235/g.53526 Transcript_33235/m.53526 type:complete len:85 (-) Transcript_33235:1854-2108(-)
MRSKYLQLTTVKSDMHIVPYCAQHFKTKQKKMRHANAILQSAVNSCVTSLSHTHILCDTSISFSHMLSTVAACLKKREISQLSS